MKNFLLLLFLVFTGSAHCQQKDGCTELSILVGIGIPQKFFGGVRVNQKQWHFDVSGGTSFEKEFTLSGNTAYHFESKNAVGIYALKPWYTSVGGSYMQRESTQALIKDVYIN